MSAILTPPIQRILAGSRLAAMTPRLGRGKQTPQVRVLPARLRKEAMPVARKPATVVMPRRRSTRKARLKQRD